MIKVLEKVKMEKMKPKKVIPYLAIILLVITGFIFFRYMDSWAGIQNDPPVSGDSKTTVEVRKAETLTILPTSTYDATLLAGEEGVVGAEVPGKVVQILFEEGEMVKKGTPLIVLDSQDLNDQLKATQAQLAAAQATLPKAEANIAISQRNYDNAKALYEAGAAAANDLSDAETALKVAQADLAALQANIGAAQSGVDRLQHSLAKLVIKAPAAGFVEDKNVAVGAYVAPGAPLAMVKNTSTIQAVIKIPQADAAKIKVGQKAKVRVSGDSQEYDGTVSYISAAASMASRTFMAKVEVPNKDNKLKAGIYANVDIVSGSEASVLVIPLKAVAGSEGSYYVFTDDNGVARRSAVTLGKTYDDQIEIKSGLTEGAAVICSNINVLQDGDLIVPAEQPTAPAEEQPLAATAGHPLAAVTELSLAAVTGQSLVAATEQGE
ncbi:MAG: efflux RND transporter periplasmic adaptor subunit [Desulfitobacteriaceae bacterium]|nr:efflux RND transporter periplasmic adaptor subunit [Desulfitobacteriaceae bacterium]MDD4346385.1 efflux RND transporter periplasmic adaptor subunit [Desulfitobacteriaceae bacterium]MDD4400938.1 efflux RND transporter periplasmic adaptor subunit [Desulfitobacteriaceae bacterium]